MKSLAVLSLFSVFTAVTARAEMRDAATHEELSLQYRKTSQEDPMSKLAAAKGPDPSTANPMKSLIGDSEVLCFNGMVTLVPKRAVLQIPKSMADRLKYQPGAKLLSWAQFYALNRGWITTVEVSRVQAAGTSAMSEVTQKQISKSANLIVATYQAGPISVLPLKVPVETTAKIPQS